MEKFDASSAVQLLGQHQVTMSQGVPTHFSRVLQLPKQLREKADLSSHRLALHAAAPCPVQALPSATIPTSFHRFPTALHQTCGEGGAKFVQTTAGICSIWV